MKAYVVSDASGATADRVVQVALKQFDDPDIAVVRHGEVRDAARLREVLEEAARERGIVIHTLVSQDMRDQVLALGRQLDVPTIDLMGPLLARLALLLEAPPRARPGFTTFLDPGYVDRLEAMNFTVRHDDGRRPHELGKADIVIAGVSRTSKTPLSIYLGYRGFRVANVPLVLGLEPPPELFEVKSHRVFGLVADPERLSALRHVRSRTMGSDPRGYADLDFVRREMSWALEIYGRNRRWKLVDVTVKTIEETAAEILSLIRSAEAPEPASGERT